MDTDTQLETNKVDYDAAMLEYRQERMPELLAVAKHYSPDVVLTLHDNLLNWALEQLGKETAMRVSNDLFTLRRYVDMHRDGQLDPALALERVDFCGAPELQEAIGHVLALMDKDGTLESWG